LHRRATPWFKHREVIEVNRKKVHRLMKGHGLLARCAAHKAKQISQRSKPKTGRPLQYTKKIVGWSLSLMSRAGEWKEAMGRRREGKFSEGVRGRGLKLISDNGS
jgi:transposase InsO family protein